MNKNLNIFLWVVFFSLMAPSGVVLASWNSVPGDTTYSWKINLENGLLAILPSDKLKSSTHSKLTERRMGEVTKILSGSHASEGLSNLSAQIITTKESLNKIDNEEDRKIAVALYIQTLNQVSSQLEQEKENRALAYLPPQNTATNYNINQIKKTNKYTTTTKTQPVASPIVPNTETTDQEDVIEEEIVEEIDDTQEEIEDVIDELENIINQAGNIIEDNDEIIRDNDNRGRNDNDDDEINHDNNRDRNDNNDDDDERNRDNNRGRNNNDN